MEKLEAISSTAIVRRARWIDKIISIGSRFGEDPSRVEAQLNSEIEREGTAALIDHLRLCGSIPAHYGHDTSEEKLYSKYTDALLAATFRYVGLTSLVLSGRADAADVEAVGANYSLIADAKAFRLSRTAKNQKDFKIESMHAWKHGKPHAMVVCPIYQLPSLTSQIYQQAIARSVCIFSYSHLAVLVLFCDESGKPSAQRLLLKVLKCAETLHPTKDSVVYWTCINRAMLSFHKSVGELWLTEKLAMIEFLSIAKEDALTSLARERERIMKMSRQDAIMHLIGDRNIDGREKVIRSRADNGILSLM
ncbi:MAG: HindIII family type II restriction endonuclease [Terriglobia bacterium]